MKFDESVKYLYGLGNEVLAMKLGLDNIRKLLKSLDNPQNKYLKVQIAGTNGKGSTCAFLEAICISAKVKVGLTTSPHLVSITERIKINNAEISEKEFARHATRVRETSEKLVESGELETVPTFFEQVTAIAFNAFAEAGIELAILETGLGGRFDATTAARAEIVAITTIDYDHQKILGDTLAEIAAEKAAIIRADTKVVVAAQMPEAANVIENVCKQYDVTAWLTNFDAEVIGADQNKKCIVNFQTAHAFYKNVHLNLRGRHQIENAKIAILLAENLQDDFKITSQNIVEGLETAMHPGRLEVQAGILLDGAHNIGGANALRKFLDEFISQKTTMIFGMMRDKDLGEIAEILFPKADKLILTRSKNARSLDTEELLLPEWFDKNKGYITYDIAESLELARRISAADDLILVTGSLYLVGEAKEFLNTTS